jgi:serine/threonine protein kinase
MNEPISLAQLNSLQYRQLEELANQFTQACDAAGADAATVDINRFLPPPGDSARPAVLHELIKTHLEICWRRGIRTTLHDYLGKFQELGSLHGLPAKLIYEEYRVRQLYGDKPGLGPYKVLFPNQFDELQRLEKDQPVMTVSSAAMTLPGDADNKKAAQPASPVNPVTSAGSSVSVGGNYKFLRRLGRGSFGEVWHAEAPGGIDVAVKIINQPLDHEEAQRELQALERIKRLRHPYLLTTMAFWSNDDRLYIAMELASCTLRDRLKQCRAMSLPGIPEQELFRYINDAAEALDFLHEQQVIHRDIKPENILILQGHGKVADFGLVRRMQSQHLASATSSGTPAYMAPEVWRGKVSVHSDQYSLAATYAEMRMDQRLFQADTMVDLMLKHLEGDPDLGPIPLGEQAVLRRALSKDPERRYGSCQEFAGQLGQALTSASSPALHIPVAKPHGDASTEQPTGKTVRPEANTWADVAEVQKQAPVPTPLPAETVQAGLSSADTSPRVVAPGWRPPAAAKPRQRRTKTLVSVVLLGIVGLALAAVWYVNQQDPVDKLLAQGEYAAALQKAGQLPADQVKAARARVAAGWLGHVQQLNKAGDAQQAYDALHERYQAFAGDREAAGDSKEAAAEVVEALVSRLVESRRYHEALELFRSAPANEVAARRRLEKTIFTSWGDKVRRDLSQGRVAEAEAAIKDAEADWGFEPEFKGLVQRVGQTKLAAGIQASIDNKENQAAADALEKNKAALGPQAAELRGKLHDSWLQQTRHAVELRAWAKAGVLVRGFLAVRAFENDGEGLRLKAKIERNDTAQAVQKFVDEGKAHLRDGDRSSQGAVEWQAALSNYEKALAQKGIEQQTDVREQSLYGKARACARLARWPDVREALRRTDAANPNETQKAYRLTLELLADNAARRPPDALFRALLKLKEQDLLVLLEADSWADSWERQQVHALGERVIGELLAPAKLAQLDNEGRLGLARDVLRLKSGHFPALVIVARGEYDSRRFPAAKTALADADAVAKTPAERLEFQTLQGLVFAQNPKSTTAEIEKANVVLGRLLRETNLSSRVELCQVYAHLGTLHSKYRGGVVKSLGIALANAAPAERERITKVCQALIRLYAADQVRVAFGLVEERKLDAALAALESLTAVEKYADKAALADVHAVHAYVTALSQLDAQDSTAAADELLKAFPGGSGPSIFRQEHRDRAAAILQEAATKVVVPPDPKQLFAQRFATPQEAEKAARWLGRAEELLIANGQQPSANLRLQLAFAAAASPRPAPSVVLKRIADVPVEATGPVQLGADALPWLLVKADAEARASDPKKQRAAVDAYEAILDLAAVKTRMHRKDAAAAVEISRRVVVPALSLVDHLRDGAGDARLQRQRAHFQADRGLLLLKNPTAEWTAVDSVLRDSNRVKGAAFAAYDTAAGIDPQGEYILGRAYARLGLAKSAADLDEVVRDARQALAKDANLSAAHGLLGAMYLIQARSLAKSRKAEKLSKIQDAVDACSAGIKLCRKDDPDGNLPTLLANRSAMYTELANHEGVLKDRHDHLDQAEADAREALRRGNTSANAYHALGNALEDLGWLIGEGKNYAQAASAFDKAVQAADDRGALYFVALGRSQYKRVAYANQADRFLGDARKALKASLNLAPKAADRAEALYWLGEVERLLHEPAQAEQHLTQAVEASRHPGAGDWADPARKALATMALADAEATLMDDPGNAAAGARLSKCRSLADELETTAPAAAARLRARCFELEGKWEQALDAYKSVPAAAMDVETRLGQLLCRSDRRLDKELRPAAADLVKAADDLVTLSKTATFDPRIKVAAQAACGLAKISAAKAVEEDQPGDALKYRREALDSLRDALKLAPRHQADMWKWQVAAAEQLSVLRDQAKNPALRKDYAREASTLLKRAMAATPSERERRRIERLLNALQEQP